MFYAASFFVFRFYLCSVSFFIFFPGSFFLSFLLLLLLLEWSANNCCFRRVRCTICWRSFDARHTKSNKKKTTTKIYIYNLNCATVTLNWSEHVLLSDKQFIHLQTITLYDFYPNSSFFVIDCKLNECSVVIAFHIYDSFGYCHR